MTAQVPPQPPTPKRVLLLFYSFSGQARRVLDAAAEVFEARGCVVERAPIEFTDERYGKPFAQFPLRRVWPDMLSVLSAQRRRQTGGITTPDTVRATDYDLVCIGSPTWWQDVSMPLRSFLESTEARPLLTGKPFAAFVVCRRFWEQNMASVRELGEKNGGRWVDGIHFEYPGSTPASMIALTGYLGTGRARERFLGRRLPPTNVSAEQLDAARAFAATVADRVFGDATASP